MRNKKVFTLIFIFAAALFCGADGVSGTGGRGASKASAAENKLTVHYVDVGQGDATVIELPDGKAMLIDGGPASGKSKFFTYMENSLSNISGFDYVILTHSDEDHCGGLDEIINRFPVRKGGLIYRPNQLSNYKDFDDPALQKQGVEAFWKDGGGNDGCDSKYAKNTLAYKRFIEAAYNQKAENVKVIVTDANSPEEMNILRDLNGDGKYDEESEEYLLGFHAPTQAVWKDNNDYSPIISLDYQGRRFLFTGDCEKDGEKRFADEAGAGKIDFGKKADVIKLGHHGSRTSSSDAFLKAVLPSESDNPNVLAVISCGAGNSYKHPHKEALDRAAACGVKEENFLRTDLIGTVVLEISGEKLEHDAVAAAPVKRKGFALSCTGGRQKELYRLPL